MRPVQPALGKVGQNCWQRLLHALQRTQRARQHLGGLFADIGNAQGIDETCEPRLLAVFDRRQQLVAGDFGKAFQIDDIVKLQRIQIGWRTDQAFIDQLLDAFVAQAFDIHRPARDEVNDRLLQLRATGQTADAAIHRTFADGFLAFAALDQLRALNVRTADRATFRYLHRTRVFRTTLGDHLHHLRDHITGTADDHGVADHQAQTCDFIHVVQRGVGHGDAGDLDRLQTRHWRHGAGAANLEFHVEQLGEFFHRREFVRDRPTRLTSPEAQFTLIGNAVDLEHHAVDFIRQRVTARADVAVVIQAFIDAFGQFQFVTDRHAPLLQLLEVADVGVGNIVGNLTDAVAAELQRTVGGDLRVELAQATSRSVAWVGEGLAADFQLRGVEALETGLGHEHFTAHFQGRRPAFTVQLQRNVAHGAHVDADVFAGGAVAARGAAHQHAVLIEQADRQAIEFRLAAVLNRRTAAEQIADR
ncbi:hypothetical protein PS624_02710 [Pseudomonas fluorescens]|uniref:Uncharacterized protein n=1 Tax=Pseudomonas fluorescens TaxID=294 RepID=A0A5E6TM91_PSEFL|nr:hypothetical protein PS624_02710 [Pseudomonas fluorescens]